MYQVGFKEKCLRSLMSVDIVQRLAPGLAARVCHPNSPPAREFTIDFHGYLYRGEVQNHLDWCAYFLKYFPVAEARIVESVANFVRRRDKIFACLDIGANVGLRTLMMARVADDVTALETVPGAFKRLDEKVSINQLSHVKCFATTLDDSAGDLDLEVLSLTNFAVARKKTALTKDTFENLSVSTVTGDDFLRQHQIGLPDFIRIDSRSDPIRTLRGLSETIRQCRPVVLIEFPLTKEREPIDEDSLRSVFYDHVSINTFKENILDGTYSIDPFEPTARKLLCFHSALRRAAEQEACKHIGLRMKIAGDI